ncbi:MAG TPA: hypothetical protein VFH39_03690, partial [Candidatus Saccharimonadales bacterium]|nr:hypothetical protein [Candidatus Saccharimonadales bacterium]
MTELDPELRCESENTFLDPADQAALLEEAQELELVDERTLRDHFLHPDTKDLATAGSVVGGLLAIYFAARALRRRDGKISMPDGDVSLHLEPAEYMKGFVSYVTKKG